MATSVYEAERRRNAAIIIAVGRQLGASTRDIMIALMVALQESGLRNLRYGHLDSVGLFQQRAGWGSFTQRMSPAISARMFFTGGLRGPGTPGLLDITNRGRMSLTQAAQAVQRSAFPNAYAKHATQASAYLGVKPAAVSGGGVVSGPGGLYIRPVSGGRITSGFGATRTAPGLSRTHHGLDMAVPVGTPVRSTAAGRVVRVTTAGAYGTRVEISHAGKIWSLYAHLSRVAVKVGQIVGAGQIIAYSGGARGASGAGNSTGPHLHFEIRVGTNSYGATRDPAAYIGKRTTPNGYLDDSMIRGPHRGRAGGTGRGAEEFVPEPGAFLTKPYIYVNPLESILDTPAMTGFNDPLLEDFAEPRTQEPVGATLEGESLEGTPLHATAAPRTVNRGLM